MPDVEDSWEHTAADRETVDLAIEESQRTMDKQIDAIERIDERGDKTARFAILVLGFTSSAIAVGGPDALKNAHPVPTVIGFLGVVMLFMSAVAGIATDSQTDIPLGMGDSFRERARTESDPRWKLELLAMYESWTTELEKASAWNARYLVRAQAALLGAMFFLLLASGMSLLNHSYSISPGEQLIWAGKGLLIGGVLALFLLKTNMLGDGT